MQLAIQRKTATKIRNGKVDRKNRSALTSVNSYTIEKVPAGKGCTHVVSLKQLTDFIELIPDWAALSHRLERITLDHGDTNDFGYHQQYRREKVTHIALCAWPRKLWLPVHPWFYHEHRHILDALGIPCEIRLDHVVCHTTYAQARAFMLLHVFIHEVGHHHDWQRRRGIGLPNKEPYAEDFANKLFPVLLPLYKERFGDPAIGAGDNIVVSTPFRQII